MTGDGDARLPKGPLTSPVVGLRGEGDARQAEPKVSKRYRWNIVRSQIRYRGFFWWLLRRVSRG